MSVLSRRENVSLLDMAPLTFYAKPEGKVKKDVENYAKTIHI
jgi:hypothetical protein